TMTGHSKSNSHTTTTTRSLSKPEEADFFNTLLGKNLHAGQGLDDLVSAFKISGRSVESFDRLVEAIDAAGQRAGKRIPIVIDGLNEAEDPRNWKDELSRADELLKGFPCVLLIVTLRNEFAHMCLPEEFPQLEHKGFQEDTQVAIDKYFEYYKIDATDANLLIEFLQHPLTLRIFCEVANPRRQPQCWGGSAT
ncbi:hypothetical protein, partial [Nitrospirillum bahiense]|uniref:hypothetical protein n=1 Tax=Nitrospirillum amazonense TaxID=28077 RepID=UPI001B3B9744